MFLKRYNAFMLADISSSKERWTLTLKNVGDAIFKEVAIMKTIAVATAFLKLEYL